MGQEREFRASAVVARCGAFLRKPVVIEIFADSSSDGEYWARTGWRRELDSNSEYG